MEKVWIVDCAHADIEAEKEVFAAHNVPYERLFCKSQDEIIEKCQGATVFLNHYEIMDEHIFKNIPTLKLVVRYGVGYNNFNVEDATKYGVQLAYVPDSGMNEVADHALALMLSLVRKVPTLNQRVHEGVWNYGEVTPILRLADSTVGLIGMGRIGQNFAKRVHAMGCRVVAYDKAYGMPGFTVPDYVEMQASIEDVLRQADIVSLHSALNKETENMLNKERFAMMKDGAYIINTSRGGLIDETALLQALESGKIRAAGLDVTAVEPIPKDHPFLGMKNVVITPHCAWYSVGAARELKTKVAQQAVDFLQGKPVRYPINQVK